MSDARAAAFAERLAGLGVVIEPREMDESTHTAKQAADAIGCSVAAIVKSLVLVADGEPLLVLASGPNRVDLDRVGQHVGAPVAMADADTVKRATGSSIGGVPPLGHPAPLRTIMDESLLDQPVVWAAAASARSVFGIEPHRLAELTAAEVARVS
ncbi:YbaK/EbsC family protein [Antiquaquibacter soli]|uniref:YbaK/EbsC family protein n=1 Tax=Antiquaquibacter soli TaxID=3064523 RepID=A0ABT9BLN1_9MICO|nr:YbaK/EbsC family protein [Protaetiibacter sp. WY-16]MDO7881916.1 YbaK/EbsC family protein [Protaetiibacter sp. WY-16]